MKEARQRAGYSQARVALAIGITQPLYSTLETGERPVRLVHLVRLAALYDRTVAELFPSYVPTPDERTLVDHGRALAAQELRAFRPSVSRKPAESSGAVAA